MSIAALQLVFLAGFVFTVLFIVAYTVFGSAKAIVLTGYSGMDYNLINPTNHSSFLLFIKNTSSSVFLNILVYFSAHSLPKRTIFQTAKYFSGGLQNGVLQSQKNNFNKYQLYQLQLFAIFYCKE